MIQRAEKDIKENVIKAIELVLKHDIFLLENDAHERSVSHKLAEYFAPLFPEHHVDCEYNRHGVEVKKIDGPKRIYPDIVIHRRNTDDNLLVVELKTNEPTNDNDIFKLKQLTAAEGPFRYFLGVSINLKDFRRPKVTWYKNGGRVDTKECQP